MPRKDAGVQPRDPRLVVRRTEPPTPHIHPLAIIEIQSEDDEWSGYSFVASLDPSGLLELSIRRTTAAAPLTARRLQKVPVGAIEQLARDELREIIELWIATNGPGAMSDWYDTLDIALDHAVGPRDFELAPLAERYVETLGDLDQRSILSEEFRWSWETIPKVIAECGRRGLLTPTMRGKSQRQLTVKALELLGRVPPRTDSTTTQAKATKRYKKLAALGQKAAIGDINQETYKTEFTKLEER